MGVKFIKTGKVVIILSGRYAGKKAIVVQAFDANQKRPYSHVLVAGLAHAPKKVTKDMGKKKILSKTSVTPFCKYINVTHIMPTRYNANDIDLKCVVAEKVEKAATRKAVKGAVKETFNKAFLEKSNVAANPKNAGVQYFFQKLRF